MPILSNQPTLFDDNPEYAAFVEKFKPRKTTDDCYTPEPIYNAVRDWACAKYAIDPATIVRPFWPGEDYTRFDYPDGCFVLDNPPFSRLSKIVRFYMSHRVRFLLFAPALSTFVAPESGVNYLCAGADITYENGAVVNTSFVTSEGEFLIEATPDLTKRLNEVSAALRNEGRKKNRKYQFPPCIVTAARMSWLSQNGQEFAVRRESARYIGKLDCKAELFGGGFLLSERAAAERAAAERAAAERAAAERAAAEQVRLSDKELAIQKTLL